MRKNIAKLHIKYAYPLDSERRFLFSQKDLDYPSIEVVKAKVSEWKKIWSKINTENIICNVINTKTSVSLPRDLELYVFGAGLNPMSNPLMMPIMRKGKEYTKSEFIETVIHEIIHRYVGDPENNEGIKDYWENMRKEYRNESITTQNHIIVFAVLKEVLSEIDQEYSSKHPHSDYQKAIDIVEKKGSGKLIEQFKSYLK